MERDMTETTTPDVPFAAGGLPTFITMMMLGVCGASVFLTMPMVAAALGSVRGFGEAQIGLFSTIQLIGMACGVTTATLAIRHLNPLRLAFGSLAVLLVLDLLPPVLADDTLFFVTRAGAGFLGGMMMSVATGYLIGTRNTDISFGVFLALQLALSMVGALVIPGLTAAFGIAGAFWDLAALHALVLVLLLLFPPPAGSIGAAEPSGHHNSRRQWTQSSAALLSVLLFFTAVGAFWTYAGMLGLQAGLPEQQVGTALSLSALGGIAGAFVPTVLGVRLGRWIPLTGAFCVHLVALFLLLDVNSFAVFAAGAALFCGAWFATYPYQVGVLSTVDIDGRPTILSAALTSIGLGLGPQLVTAFPSMGLQAIFPIALVFFTGALIVISAVIWSARRPALQPA